MDKTLPRQMATYDQDQLALMDEDWAKPIVGDQLWQLPDADIGKHICSNPNGLRPNPFPTLILLFLLLNYMVQALQHGGHYLG